MKLPSHTKDGVDLVPPDPTTPVGQLIYLIEWARIRGVRIGPAVQIGDLVIQIADLRQTEGSRDAPVDPGWLAAHGHTE